MIQKQLHAIEVITELGHGKGSGIGDHPSVFVWVVVCGAGTMGDTTTRTHMPHTL